MAAGTKTRLKLSEISPVVRTFRGRLLASAFITISYKRDTPAAPTHTNSAVNTNSGLRAN